MMAPDGTSRVAGILVGQSGHPMPFGGTVTITPRQPVPWWRRLYVWLRSFPG